MTSYRKSLEPSRKFNQSYTSPPPLTRVVALTRVVDRACAVTHHSAMLSLDVLQPNSNSAPIYFFYVHVDFAKDCVGLQGFASDS